MLIYLLWDALFAMQLYILKSNKAEVEEFEGINTAMGYMFLAFENGIGNIQSPTVDNWLSEYD